MKLKKYFAAVAALSLVLVLVLVNGLGVFAEEGAPSAGQPSSESAAQQGGSSASLPEVEGSASSVPQSTQQETPNSQGEAQASGVQSQPEETPVPEETPPQQSQTQPEDAYTVTFYSYGGELFQDPVLLPAGSYCVAPSSTPQASAGYQFSGWYTVIQAQPGQPQGEAYNFESTPLTGELKLYAHCTEVASFSPLGGVYTVTFVNGSQSFTQTVDAGTLCPEPAAPEVPQGMAAFMGWYLNSGERFVFHQTPVTQDITLTAQFAACYTGTFKNADGVVADIKAADASNLLLPTTANVPAPAGTQFKHWYLQGSPQTEPFDFGAPLTGNVVLLPYFANVYTVAFVTQGSVVAPQLIEEGGKAIQPANPTRAGYVFSHWGSVPGAPSAGRFRFDTTPIEANTTVHAVWEAETVTYNVVFWLEKANLGASFDPGADKSNYEHACTVQQTAQAGTVLSVTQGQANAWRNQGNVPNSVRYWATFAFGDANVVVSGNGNTSIHVYRKRTVYTLTFDLQDYTGARAGTRSMQAMGKTYTNNTGADKYVLQAKYGQDIQQLVPHGMVSSAGQTFVSWNSEVGSMKSWHTARSIVADDMLPLNSTTTAWNVNASWGSGVSARCMLYYGEVKNEAEAEVTYNGKSYKLLQANIVYADFSYAKAWPGYVNVRVSNTGTVVNPDDGKTYRGRTFYYDLASYTLTFNAGPGHFPTGGAIYTVTGCHYGDAIELPPHPPQRDNYEFSGWYTDANLTEELGETRRTMPDGNYTLYAKYVSQVHRVQYFDFPGDATPVEIQNYGPEDDMAYPSLYTKGETYEGRGEFLGWYYYPYEGSALFEFFTELPLGSYDVYGMWKAAYHTVTYNSMGGGSVSPQQVIQGRTLTQSGLTLPVPAKTGYKFMGWYANPANTATRFTAGTVVNAPLEVFALWETDSAKWAEVQFDVDGGAPAMEPIWVLRGTALDANMPQAPAKSTYVFGGWQVVSGGMQGAEFTAQTTVNQDMVVQAVWNYDTADWVKVEFKTDGGSEVETQWVLRGKPLAESMPTPPVKDTYLFNGWAVVSGGTFGTAFTSSTVVTQNMVVRANWAYNPASWMQVEFDADGGDPKTETRWVLKGGTLGDEMPRNPVKDTFIFQGWAVVSGGAVGSPFTAGTTVTQNMQVRAQWAHNTQTWAKVQFDTDGGDEIEDIWVIKGESLGANLPTPVKATYLFNGWSTATDDGTLQAFTAATPVYSDTQVKANWQYNIEDWAKVEFDTDGGAPVEARWVLKGKGLGAMPVTTKATFLFQNWVLASTGAAFTGSTPVTQNITLRAVWAPNPQQWAKVQFNTNGGNAINDVWVLRGESLGDNMPQNPQRENYLFTGWITSVTGMPQAGFTAQTKVESDLVVQANWAHDTEAWAKVEFDSAGGSAVEPIWVLKGEHAGGAMPDNPTKDTYWFDGWTMADGGEFTGDTTVEQDIKVRANWAYNSSNWALVTFNSNGGSQVESQWVPRGESLGANMPQNPTKATYQFSMWVVVNNIATYSSAGAMADTPFTSETPVYYDITVEAVWQPEPLYWAKVSFITDAGYEIEDVWVKRGAAVGEQMPQDPYRHTYEFAGWQTDSGQAFNAGSIVNNNTVVTALWQQDVAYWVQVSFNMGGPSSPLPSVWLLRGSSFSRAGISLPAPARQYYTFNGWGATGSADNFTENTIVQNDITLTASWQKDAAQWVKVDFDTGKGTGSTVSVWVVKGKSVALSPEAKMPAPPTLSGSQFLCWQDTGGNTFTEHTTVNGNMAVTAQFGTGAAPQPGAVSPAPPSASITRANPGYVPNAPHNVTGGIVLGTEEDDSISSSLPEDTSDSISTAVIPPESTPLGTQISSPFGWASVSKISTVANLFVLGGMMFMMPSRKQKLWILGGIAVAFMTLIMFFITGSFSGAEGISSPLSSFFLALSLLQVIMFIVYARKANNKEFEEAYDYDESEENNNPIPL